MRRLLIAAREVTGARAARTADVGLMHALERIGTEAKPWSLHRRRYEINQPTKARAETCRLCWRSRSVTLVFPAKRRPVCAADATNLNMCFIDKVVDRLTWPAIHGSIEQQLSTISVLLTVLHD